MIRRWVFAGLTSVLVVALAYLFIQSRKKEETDRTTRMSEMIKTSKPTLTRVFHPGDLEIVESKMTLVSGATTGQKTASAKHALSIRNNGKMAYQSVIFEITYRDQGGRELDRRGYRLSDPLTPGNRNAEFQIDEVPARTRTAENQPAT